MVKMRSTTDQGLPPRLGNERGTPETVAQSAAKVSVSTGLSFEMIRAPAEAMLWMWR